MAASISFTLHPAFRSHEQRRGGGTVPSKRGRGMAFDRRGRLDQQDAQLRMVLREPIGQLQPDADRRHDAAAALLGRCETIGNIRAVSR